MTTTPYSEIDAALALVNQLTELEPSDSVVRIKLQDSAGIDSYGAKQYRIYFVSARLLQQSRSDQTLKEADQVVFTNLDVMIRSLFEDQLAVDLAYGWIIPPGMSAEVALGLEEEAPVMPFSGLVA